MTEYKNSVLLQATILVTDFCSASSLITMPNTTTPHASHQPISLSSMDPYCDFEHHEKRSSPPSYASHDCIGPAKRALGVRDTSGTDNGSSFVNSKCSFFLNFYVCRANKPIYSIPYRCICWALPFGWIWDHALCVGRLQKYVHNLSRSNLKLIIEFLHVGSCDSCQCAVCASDCGNLSAYVSFNL
jgi:hypothetical protein